MFNNYSFDTEYPRSPVTSSKGFTKLMYLVNNQKVILKEDLEKLKLEINEKNEKGWTASMIACRNSNTKSSIETVRLLLDHGAKIDMQNNNGRTALMMAASYSHEDSNIETVRLLLDRGAKIDMQDNDGWTALMMTVRYNHTDSNIETVKLLLDYGAKIDIQNNNGCNSLMIIHSLNNNKNKIKIYQVLSNYSNYRFLHCTLTKNVMKSLKNIYNQFRYHPDSYHTKLLSYRYTNTEYKDIIDNKFLDYYGITSDEHLKTRFRELESCLNIN